MDLSREPRQTSSCLYFICGHRPAWSERSNSLQTALYDISLNNLISFPLLSSFALFTPAKLQRVDNGFFSPPNKNWAPSSIDEPSKWVLNILPPSLFYKNRFNVIVYPNKVSTTSMKTIRTFASSTRTFFSCSHNVIAADKPAMPAPTIITSYL